MKESIQTAVRMVGYLLEHNGITGPFVADAEGNPVSYEDPNACQWCMAGAIQEVNYRLGLPHEPAQYQEWGHALTSAVLHALGRQGQSRTLVWEGHARETTPAERLAIARKLQSYEES